MKVLFVANWMQGNGLSGGDRIWIEFAKKWSNRLKIVILGSPEARKISSRYGAKFEFIQGVKKIKEDNNLNVLKLIKNIITRTYQIALFLKKNNYFKKKSFDYVYTTSDFLPDSFAGLLMKLKNRKIIWIAGFYLFAPLPWQKNSPYKGINSIKGLMYYLLQLPIYFFVNRYADYVFVTSEPDIKRFITKKRGAEKVIVIQGGVDVTESEESFKKGRMKAISEREYDACFIGRMHFQKGVLALVDIWKLVCEKEPNRKLIMIGDGELKSDVEAKIEKFNLQNNIKLVGFLDGAGKFDVFNKSRIVVHPATYDSGGMAAAEAMAWGLPGVSFDLEALETYYPKGMIKTTKDDLAGFADNILKLLNNKKLYDNTSRDAHKLILEVWDWSVRSENIYRKVFDVK